MYYTHWPVLCQVKFYFSHRGHGERINLVGHFGLLIDPASKANFCKALTLGLGRYPAALGA